MVYTENIALAEKLYENIKEEELLKRVNKRLKEENSLLEAEAENNKAVVKEKQSDSQRKAAKIKEVRKNFRYHLSFLLLRDRDNIHCGN